MANREPAPLGAFSLVLHTHLPYCRMAGRWPHGEEWLHEALAETYLPLLDALYNLRDAGARVKITLNLTPVLVEQLADADVLAHFRAFLANELAAAEEDRARFAAEGEAELTELAVFYIGYYQHMRRILDERLGGDVVGAFRDLQETGMIEIITCAATHGYLPLLSRDSSIYAQIQAAVASHTRHFGRAPRAIWLPECAYRPAQQGPGGAWRPGLEEFLSGFGLRTFFVETRAILGAQPRQADDLQLGPYGEAERRYRTTMGRGTVAAGTTFAPYDVVSRDGHPTHPPVAAVGRNERTGMQVWSAGWGYPGDAEYREFHRKDAHSGLQYWRVTGPGVDLGAKALYRPERAAERVRAHAAHFAQLVEGLLREHQQGQGGYGLIASNYDTELFGHWWFEGVEWIRQSLAAMAAQGTVDVTSVCDYVEAHPPRESIALAEGSWGAGGTHWTWDNPDTHWMWVPIHAAEQRMEQLVARYPQAGERARTALCQAGRELLLLESSDWPFLVTTGQAAEYATRRFESHVERFGRLAGLLEAGELSQASALAVELYALDNVFPDLDYVWFAERQGRAR